MAVHVTTKVVTQHRFSAREFRALSKAVWAEAGQFWHTEILPKHFKRGANREYRYARRTRRYNERKARIHGHTDPLVFSGQLRSQVLSSPGIRARGNTRSTQGRVTVTLRGPRYMYATNGRQPDKAAELSALSNRDLRDVARVIDQRLAEQLNKPGRREVLR